MKDKIFKFLKKQRIVTQQHQIPIYKFRIYSAAAGHIPGSYINFPFK
jgi:hypothetical protein